MRQIVREFPLAPPLVYASTQHCTIPILGYIGKELTGKLAHRTSVNIEFSFKISHPEKLRKP